MAKRLIAFGCSNTYGEALPDCWDNDHSTYGPNPSKFAWPQLTADALNLECINLGVPGTSNKQICNDVLNTEFEETDIVVIMWTYVTRTCFFQNKEEVMQYGGSKNSKRILVQDVSNTRHDRERRKYNAMYYKSFYTDANSNIESYMYLNLVNLFLSEKGIKSYHISCNSIQHGVRKSLQSFTLSPPEWNCVDLPNIINCFIDKALDNAHPGIESQKNVSNVIRKYIEAS